MNIPCYLRTLRREWGLTQEELAGLLPNGSRARVSDVELAKAQPNAEEILAYSLIFGMLPGDIFPAVYDSLEEEVIRRAYALDEALAEDGSHWTRQKKRLLRALLARATGKAPNPNGV